MCDCLLLKVPSGVLKRVKLCGFPDISGALWCVRNGRIMRDFLIFLVPSGGLGRIKL